MPHGPGGLRYQVWKIQVLPEVITPGLRPTGPVMPIAPPAPELWMPKRLVGEPAQRMPSPNGVDCCVPPMNTMPLLDGKGRRTIERLVRDSEATVLFVARDAETARRAQCLWFLDGGMLTELGPPDRLLDGDGPAAGYFRRRIAA